MRMVQRTKRQMRCIFDLSVFERYVSYYVRYICADTPYQTRPSSNMQGNGNIHIARISHDRAAILAGDNPRYL